ncbi:hypothetical protein, partial [Antrihabitans stalactiti]|uniref:hypothetical protein n=1 Tax=Antrihabitans stalactiti TaxID=2584121 RepID=UPI0019818B15
VAPEDPLSVGVMVCACSLRTQQCVDECQCQLVIGFAVFLILPVWGGQLLVIFLWLALSF